MKERSRKNNVFILMAKKKKKVVRKKKRASRKKHMAYYCVRCGTESMKKVRHNGTLMEKC